MIPSMQSTTGRDNTTTPLRTAIAMNNLAIAMIEKQCYEQGSQTLYDAYQIIRHIINEQQQQQCNYTNDYHINTANDISVSYHNHHEALFRVSTCSNNNNRNKCLYKSPISYEVITPIINEPIYIDMDSTSSSKLYFVRLEDTTSFITGQPFSIVECSIILNNLAVSYLILSTIGTITTTPKHNDCIKYRNIACTFLRLACTLYMNNVIDTSTTCVQSNLDIYRLYGYIVSNTNKILYACGIDTITTHTEYNSIFCSKTIHICNTIQRIESFFLACTDGNTSNHSAAMA